MIYDQGKVPKHTPLIEIDSAAEGRRHTQQDSISLTVSGAFSPDSEWGPCLGGHGPETIFPSIWLCVQPFFRKLDVEGAAQDCKA